ncbi:MAG: hypothetical protein ACYC2E_12785 [Sulfuricella sp.]
MRSLVIRFFILLGLFFPVFASAVTPMVTTSYYHTVALKSDGTVVEWGDNYSGGPYHVSAVAVPGLVGVVSVYLLRR